MGGQTTKDQNQMVCKPSDILAHLQRASSLNVHTIQIWKSELDSAYLIHHECTRLETDCVSPPRPPFLLKALTGQRSYKVRERWGERYFNLCWRRIWKLDEQHMICVWSYSGWAGIKNRFLDQIISNSNFQQSQPGAVPSCERRWEFSFTTCRGSKNSHLCSNFHRMTFK